MARTARMAPTILSSGMPAARSSSRSASIVRLSSAQISSSSTSSAVVTVEA
jgi:hypothetical protein